MPILSWVTLSKAEAEKLKRGITAQLTKTTLVIIPYTLFWRLLANLEKLHYEKTENAKFIIRALIGNMSISKYINHLGRQLVIQQKTRGYILYKGSQCWQALGLYANVLLLCSLPYYLKMKRLLIYILTSVWEASLQDIMLKGKIIIGINVCNGEGHDRRPDRRGKENFPHLQAHSHLHILNPK